MWAADINIEYTFPDGHLNTVIPSVIFHVNDWRWKSVTLDAGNENVANAQLDIAGSKVWAVIFSFRIQ